MKWNFMVFFSSLLYFRRRWHKNKVILFDICCLYSIVWFGPFKNPHSHILRSIGQHGVYILFSFSILIRFQWKKNTNEREGVEKKAQNFVVKIFKIDKYLNTRPWITQNKKLNSNFLTKVSFIFQLKSFFISLLLTQQIL